MNNGHVLVVPREHYESWLDVPGGSRPPSLPGHDASSPAAVRQSPDPRTLNIVGEQRPAAGQDEPHYHVHIIPRREGDGFDIPLPFSGSPDARPQFPQLLRRSHYLRAPRPDEGCFRYFFFFVTPVFGSQDL